MVQFLNELKTFIENKSNECKLKPELKITESKILFITSNNYLISKYFLDVCENFLKDKNLIITENKKNCLNLEKSLQDIVSIIKESCHYVFDHAILLNNYDIFFDDETCISVAKELIDYSKTSNNNLKAIIILTNRSKTIEPFLMHDPSHLKVNQAWCLGEYICRKIEEKSMEQILSETINAVNDTVDCKYY